MAVNQHRRRAGHRRRLGVHQRMPGRFDQFGFQPQRFKLLEHPFARAAHVGFVLAVGADAGDAQQIAQFVFKSLRICVR